MHTDLLAILAALVLAVLQERPADPPAYRVAAAPAPGHGLLDPAARGWDAARAVRWGTSPYATAFRALHDPAGLWVRFDADDDGPWHTLTERDAPLWQEEVVEIFIDPDGDGRNYAELEISPAGVVTDLAIERGWPDLRSDIRWDLEGLVTQVSPVDGGVWTAIAHIPWDALAALPATTVATPPAPGDRWRFNVFRIKRPGGPERPEDGLVLAAWSPVPGPSFHVPERFGWMEFER